MHPYLAYQVAEQRRQDLSRAAGEWRLSRSSRGEPASRKRLRTVFEGHREPKLILRLRRIFVALTVAVVVALAFTWVT
ncbi:MAG: hypothetical protein ABSC00_10445 [Acidimicrobiales bacterium]